MQRILVSLPDGVLKLVKELASKLGETDSATIRTIVISFLIEKGYLMRREKP